MVGEIMAHSKLAVVKLSSTNDCGLIVLFKFLNVRYFQELLLTCTYNE